MCSPLPKVAPEKAGMQSACLATIDTIVAQAIADREFPGCVVCIGRRGKIAYHKAFGYCERKPFRKPMRLNTVFDVASLTKPIATSTSIMILVDQGKLRLDDAVVSYIPAFTGNGREKVTIRDLLLHQSGLCDDNPLADYKEGYKAALQKICALPFRKELCGRHLYLDVNYMLLGDIIERVSGKRLHEFAQENIFRVLGMKETMYLPHTHLRLRAAPNGMRNDSLLKGLVHDRKTELMGGVAGHAGLFSTADDLAVYANMMLNKGLHAQKPILKPSAISKMTAGHTTKSAVRALGWDKRSEHSTNRASKLSARAFGHGGFTGVALWIDPQLDLFYIVLSNRNLERNKENVYHLIARIGDIAIEAIIEEEKALPNRMSYVKQSALKS